MATGPGGVEVGRVSVRVVPDTSKFRNDLVTKLRTIEKQLKIEIPVDFDTKGAIRQLSVLQKRIGQLNQNLTVNSNVKELSTNLDKVGNSAGNAGGQILGMSRFMAIGLGVAVLLAPALGLIATLIAGLPSLLFAAGAGFAAIALGMDGIKEAAKVLGPAVKEMKEALSATFVRTLTPVFEQLKGIMPTLQGGLQRVAVGLSQMAKSFVDVVTSAQGMRDIQSILFQTGRFFSKLDVFVTQFTQALLTLGRVGGESFDLLAVTLNRFGTDFNKVVQRLDESGALRSALVGLAEVTNSLLSLFNRLFEAGVNIMGELGGPLKTLIDGVADLLIELLPILSDLSGVVADVLGKALSALAPLFRQLAPIIEKVANILGKVLVKAIELITPILTDVADLLSGALMTAFKTLEPLLPPLMDFFTQLSKILGESLSQALIIVLPLIQQLIQFAVNLLTAMLPLLPSILEFVDMAMKALLDVLQEVVPEVMKLAAEVFPTLMKIVKELVPVFIDMLRIFTEWLPVIADIALFVLSYVIPALRELVRIWADTWDSLIETFAGWLEFMKGNLKFFIGFFTGDWEMMWEGIKQAAAGAWEGIKSGLQAFLGALDTIFFGLPSRIISTLGNLGMLLFESGRALIRGLIDGIKNMAQTAVNNVKSIVGEIRSFFPFSPAQKGPFSGTGYTLYSGRALIEDWARGIREGTPDAVRAIDDAMGASSGTLEMNSLVQSDGFGGIGDSIRDAMSQWTIEIDPNGIARMVNKVNRKNERR
jgi:phage-related protein